MARTQPLEFGSSGRVGNRAALSLAAWATGWLLVVLLLPASAGTAAPWQGWPSWVVPSWVGGAVPPTTDLDSAIAALRAHPEAIGQVTLAAHATGEGHWIFANRAGERFTAGTPAELTRVPQALAPDAKSGFADIGLILSQDTLFTGAVAYRSLPPTRSRLVAVGGELFVVRGGPGTRQAVALRPGVALTVDDRDTFTEALAQLRRPLDAARMRILSAQAGGPAALSPVAKFDASQGGAAIDMLDPDRMADVLSAIPRQTAILTARLDGANLTVLPPTGGERTISLAALQAAAARADVDVLFLHADPPRQPGGRNWLWQRIQVGGLDHATKRGMLADFLDQLSAGRGAFMVTVTPDGVNRVRLIAQPLTLPLTTTDGVTGWIKQAAEAVTGQVTGAVQPAAVHASLVADARRRELDRRLLPGLPSSATAIYLGIAAIGLLGLPVARRWWVRLWPREKRADYSNARGYLLARAIRAMAFIAVFLPLAALPALVAKLIELIAPGKPQPR